MRIFGFSTFFLVLILASIGCESRYQREERWLIGTIQSVRIVTSQKEEVGNNHPVLGAVIGGALAGVPGAAVGALAGSASLNGQSQTKIKDAIVGCRFVVKLDGEATVAFTYPYNFTYGLSQCVTLREADRIKIAKIRYESGEIIYWWRVDPYRHPRGEVISN